MKKRFLRVLLCLIMVIGLLPTAVLAEETAPAFDLAKDLAGITIPGNLVTCTCTEANQSKSYGQLPTGFSSSKVEKEKNVWTVIISVENSVYKEQFDKDTGSTHSPNMKHSTDFTTPIQFKLGYKGKKWSLVGDMPAGILRFTCTGNHKVPQPEMPVSPTADNIDDLGNQIVAVICSNVHSGQQSGKYYGLIDGGFTSTEPVLNQEAVYESTVTLIPSAYCSQYSTDTGSRHNVKPDTDVSALTFTVTYDSKEMKWIPSKKISTMDIWATCDEHEVPVAPAVSNIGGLSEKLVAVLCNNVPSGGTDGRYYNLLDGSFAASKLMLVKGKYECKITLAPSVYCKQYSSDSQIEHELDNKYVLNTSDPSIVLQYDNETMTWTPKNEPTPIIIGVKCDKHAVPQPELPVYPTTENIDGLGDQIVAVICSNVPSGQQSGKYYGLIDGGFTSTEPVLNQEAVYESTVTLIPSAYCNQFSTDTGITHKLLSAQTTEGLSFTVKYDSEKKMWVPAGEVKQMGIWVNCEKHEVQTYTVTVSNDGYGTGMAAPATASVGTEITLTAEPSAGYRFKEWQVVSGDVTITNNNFSMPGTNVEVKVVFEQIPVNEYTVTFNGNGGTPSETTMVTTSKKLTSLPSAVRSGRYRFDGWYTEMSGGKMITIETMFDKDATVYAHWSYTGSNSGGRHSYNSYTIKATAGKNGSISPAGNVSVREGKSQTFAIISDKGYTVSNVLIDGKSIGTVESYTFENVKKAHTIEVVFMKSSGAPQTRVFVDVPEGSYYEEAVSWAVTNGITQGADATHFSPDGICTRAQAVTFLWRAAGSPAPKATTMPFTDIPAGSYYYDAVLWAVENGVTKGTSATEFSPEEDCSRAQIVTFLWRAENSPAAGTVNPFTDVKIDAYYADAVLWAVKENITKGTTDTTFSPNANCTRAQIVTFIWRALAE